MTDELRAFILVKTWHWMIRVRNAVGVRAADAYMIDSAYGAGRPCCLWPRREVP